MNKKLTLLSTAMLSATSLFAADKNPNIILILADDMRGTAMDFLGVEDIHTPNLDKLAAESTVFTNAHIMGGTSGAVSMPSRAMLMTGKYLYTLEKQGATVPEDHKLIGETLQQSGYNSFHTGKWHNGYQAMNRCFNDGKGIYFGGMWDHWNVPLYDYNADCDYSNKRPVVKDWAKSNVITYEKGEYMLSGKHSVDIFTEDAVEYIEKQKEAGKPFFLSVAYMSPHDPRTMPDEYMRQYDFDNIQLPPNYMDKHPFDNGELVIRDEVLAAIPRVPDEIKKQRKARLAAIQAGISREYLESYLGTAQTALVDAPNPEWPNLYDARLWFQAPEVDGLTYLSCENCGPGDMVECSIEDAGDYDLSALGA